MSSSQLTFSVPDGYSREQVAEIFTAYLLDMRAHDNFRPAPDQPRRFGPFRNPTSIEDDRWQLEPGNDFFLSFEENTAILSHRGAAGQETKCLTMLALFQVMHPNVTKRAKLSVA